MEERRHDMGPKIIVGHIKSEMTKTREAANMLTAITAGAIGDKLALFEEKFQLPMRMVIMSMAADKISYGLIMGIPPAEVAEEIRLEAAGLIELYHEKKGEIVETADSENEPSEARDET